MRRRYQKNMSATKQVTTRRPSPALNRWTFLWKYSIEDIWPSSEGKLEVKFLVFKFKQQKLKLKELSEITELIRAIRGISVEVTT